MQVKVERVVDPRKGIVAVQTSLGPLRVVWEGEQAPTGGAHDVELDIPAILEWGREIWRASDGVPEDHPSRAQRLSGKLLELDEVGVATIRVPDGHLLVETFGDPPLGTVGEEVELEPPAVHAFPVRY